jgi:hypothetical protein
MMTKFHFEEMKIFKTFLAKILRINEKIKHENSNSQRVYVFFYFYLIIKCIQSKDYDTV